jgi:hypothetical protein
MDWLLKHGLAPAINFKQSALTAHISMEIFELNNMHCTKIIDTPEKTEQTIFLAKLDRNT